MTTIIDTRIADMLGGPVIAVDTRQRGVVETLLRGCRRRRRFRLRYVQRDSWLLATGGAQ